jgi:hypothetical protein
VPRNSVRTVRVFMWSAWVGLNVMGVLSAYVLSVSVAAVGGSVGLQVSDRMIVAIMVILIGLLMGVAQWLLVRPYLPDPALWIAATLVGWLLPIAILVVFFPPSIANQRSQIGIVLASTGLMMGAAQYLLLRRHRLHSGWWILASMLGWTILALTLPIPITNQLEILKVGAVPALITGIPFVFTVASKSGIEAETGMIPAA